MFLDFEVVVKKICVFSIDELVEEYLKLKEDIRKFLCMDLIYQYLFFVLGFQV